MRAIYFLLGYEDLEISPRHTACFLNLCRSSGRTYQPLPQGGEGLRVRCLSAVASELRRACRTRGIEVKTLHRGGLPAQILRYRYRVGILIGLIAAFLLLWAGSGVLWDVRVSGNSRLTTEEILAQLSDCGLEVGVDIRADKLDTREVENRLLRASPDIAWVSVNIRGTVAQVQVRELQNGQSEVDKDICNLVASCDGIITEVHLLSGEVVVDVGQEVRAGELLISGVRDSATQGFDVMGARGEVIARTTHREIIQIPLKTQEKVPTGEEFSEKTLFFFKKSIKFSKKTGIMEGSCDTIYTLEKFTLPTGTELPFGVQTVRYVPYVLTEVERTREQAYALAREQLDARLQESAGYVLLLSKTIQVSYSDTHCILTCDYTCLRDIATQVPLEWVN